MSVGATPSLQFIGSTVGDVAPHSLSEMRGIRFSDGTNSPTSGAISLGNFRNKVLTREWLEEAKIQGSDTQAGHNFGYSVAISPNGYYAIVGSSVARAAYIFVRSNTSWSQQAKIQASDDASGNAFGWSVSISRNGDYVVVGAPFEDTGENDVGAAYIFTRSNTTWSQQAKIQASDLDVSGYFGYNVSISWDGDYVIAGSHGNDAGVTNAGAAYIFTRSNTTWSQQAKIRASDKQAADFFGWSVSIAGNKGDYAIIGALYEDTGGSNAGAAYIFVRSGTTWSQQAKIQAQYPTTADVFGISVSMSGDGDYVIVGAYGDDTYSTGEGAAYIFTRSNTTWSQQARIIASDGEANDSFGWRVAISGDGNHAVVGATGEDTGGNEAGAAYIFARSGTTWTEVKKIQASDKQYSDYFSWSVAISMDGTHVIVGATSEDSAGTDAGAAYIFKNSYYVS